jgi:hypothetical protein
MLVVDEADQMVDQEGFGAQTLQIKRCRVCSWTTFPN